MVYIHIPFCCSFCTYCDFYSEIASGQDTGLFIKALCSEIRVRKDEITGEPSTLYIGGGTPSVLPLSAVSDVVSCVKGTLGFDAEKCFTEFTVEVNPEDIIEKGKEYVEGLVRLGVNRISMGVQSFDDGLLRWMNRRHDASAAQRAYEIISDGGIGNISIDLIFGISQLGDRLWEETLDKALSLSPKHISAYQLSVETGSALASLVRSGKYVEAPESQCRRQYEILCRKLAHAGYRHYEISNFALPGYEAVHNSAYWRHVPYAGFGPGAHSFLACDCGGMRKWIRSWNLPDIRKYTSYFLGSAHEYSQEGQPCRCVPKEEVSQHEELTPDQMAIEHIMLGLRTDTGVEKTYLEEHTDRSRLDVMLREGFLVEAADPHFIRIPEKHFFISDSIVSEII